MGVNLRDLLIREEVSLADLKNKTLAVDAYNMLFQFLSSIRGPDGSLFTDSKGRVTSHLIGLFSRVTKLMSEGILLIFVFDGTPPVLKHKESQKRKALKVEAEKKYQEALERSDIDTMKKYASRTSRLTTQMVDEAKRLLTLLGIPVVQAPSEGEAQAAFLVEKGHAYAVSSQDYDSILYGAPLLIQNISIVGRKKKPGQLGTITVRPLAIDLQKNLDHLSVSRKQLIAIAMLIGTDFHPGGVHGLGPKKALALVKNHGEDFNKIFEEAKWDEHAEVSWQDVFKVFTEMPKIAEYSTTQKAIMQEELIDFLVVERDFRKARIENTITSLLKKTSKRDAQQKSLASFFQ